MKAIKKIYGLITLMALSGCEHGILGDSPKVVLPATPPLSAQVLEEAAGSCLKEVSELESRTSYVPEERRREFRAVMSLAKDNCSELTETLERLKRASHQEQSYRHNIEHAKATMLPGTTITRNDQGDNIANTQGTSFGVEVNNEPLR